MTNVIPDLWPEDIADVNMVSPLSILRVQAGQLGRKTKGLVEAEVVVQSETTMKAAPLPETQELARECYYLDLIAPALDRYRYRLLKAWHEQDRVYPIRVKALDGDGEREVVCSTQADFVSALSEIFRSQQAKSTISSIIARSNEKRALAEPVNEGEDND